MQTATSSKPIVIQRVFDLPVEVVWSALTEPDIFKKWWGPKGFTCPVAKLGNKVGDKYLACMRADDGKEFWSAGEVKEMVPNEKLVVTDYFSDEKGNLVNPADQGMPGNWPDELLVSYELQEADGATKLKLTHEGMPPEMYDECVKGWSECFDKLEENIR